jgi:DNA primase
MEIRKKQECVLVEGYTDVIMLFQAGFQNAVATSGTALTPYQLKILKRYSENLLTAFDMDVAGDSATKRGIDLAQTFGFNVKVLLLPQDSDPADIIFKNPKSWEKILKGAKSILDFYFETTFSCCDSKDPEGKKTISRILLPVIKRIPNSIERSFWLQELAKRLRVREEDVFEEMKKNKMPEEIYGLEPEEMVSLPQKSRRALLEERLITLILKSPQNLRLVDKDKISLLSSKGKEILTNIKKNPDLPKAKNLKWEGDETGEYFNQLALKAEIEEIEEKEILPEIQICLKEIHLLEIKSKLDQISRDLKKAESEEDSGKIQKLVKDFNQLTKEMKTAVD